MFGSELALTRHRSDRLGVPTYMASGVRNLNCAIPETTSELAPNSTVQGLVPGVRHHFVI
eukprot:6675612-Alexandrium_andersonii.AAC.1